jgi:hypothetical protein
MKGTSNCEPFSGTLIRMLHLINDQRADCLPTDNDGKEDTVKCQACATLESLSYTFYGFRLSTGDEQVAMEIQRRNNRKWLHSGSSLCSVKCMNVVAVDSSSTWLRKQKMSAKDELS